MTRDEIRLIVFVLLAIALGSTVRWWRGRDLQQSAVLRVEDRKSGWADPPYVFKTKAEMERIGTEVKKSSSPPRTEAVPTEAEIR